MIVQRVKGYVHEGSKKRKSVNEKERDRGREEEREKEIYLT